MAVRCKLECGYPCVHGYEIGYMYLWLNESYSAIHPGVV